MLDGDVRLSRRRPRRRSRLLLPTAAALTMVAGALSLALGVHVAGSTEDLSPVPLQVGEVFTAPTRVAFAGDLVLYGRPLPGGRPGLDELGCVVSGGGGAASVTAARDEDRIVVDGVGLVPLVSYPGRAGYSMVCTGPPVTAAAPLYMVPGRNPRSLVPLSAYSLAALLVPLGAVGLLIAREQRD